MTLALSLLVLTPLFPWKAKFSGLILPQSSIFNHWHGGAINQNVLDKTTGLLNQKSDEDLFSRYGFPVNCWPSGDSN